MGKAIRDLKAFSWGVYSYLEGKLKRRGDRIISPRSRRKTKRGTSQMPREKMRLRREQSGGVKCYPESKSLTSYLSLGCHNETTIVGGLNDKNVFLTVLETEKS